MSNECSPFVFIQFELVKVPGLYLMHQRDINEVGLFEVQEMVVLERGFCGFEGETGGGEGRL